MPRQLDPGAERDGLDRRLQPGVGRRLPMAESGQLAQPFRGRPAAQQVPLQAAQFVEQRLPTPPGAGIPLGDGGGFLGRQQAAGDARRRQRRLHPARPAAGFQAKARPFRPPGPGAANRPATADTADFRHPRLLSPSPPAADRFLPRGGKAAPPPGRTCRVFPSQGWHAACDARPGRATEPILAGNAFARAKSAVAAAMLLGLWLGLALAAPAAAQPVRIKDIADVEGVRENQLVGYGLVVGLNGTGDKLRTAVFTRQTLIGMLERLGVNTRDNELRLETKNVAAVMVTTNLPPFARPGGRIDVSVSALGDATNLMGGTLLVTPLLGADGEVYAVAQGAVSTGAVAARGAGASVTRGVPTAARIASGAIIEREIPYQLNARDQLRLALRNPDLTTARRIAAVINRALGGNAAAATDPRTVVLAMQGRDPVSVLGAIDQLRVEPDQAARVIIEEASGTIVMGSNVRVSTVAIAQGNLTIRVTETPQVSQPNALAQGQTVVTPRTNIEIDDQADRKMGVLRGGVTLQELVRGLNSLGVGPRDLISILQTIKAAGALQAELELR